MKRALFSFAILLCSVLVANAQYKLGDIYDKDGVKGLVVKVDAKGEHGLVMSLEGSGARWCTGDVKMAVGATDENDGAANMAAVEKMIAKKKLSWEAFPLFEWARSLGEGWYIPSKNELQAIMEYVNGGSLDKYNQKSVKAVDKKLKKNGGKGFIMSAIGSNNEFRNLYSSTEATGNNVYEICFVENATGALTSKLGKFVPRQGKLKFMPGLKKSSGGKLLQCSRAVHKF